MCSSDLIGGYFVPTSGRIFWNQTDIGAMPPGKRPVSTLFQDNNLFPHLTVAQNVGLALKPDLRLGAEEKGWVEAALAEVGLEGFAGRKPGTLSGGQASRAALARVLLQSRPLILLDEPFSALGPAMRREMLDLVAEKLKGRTVLMVTHDPEDAKQIADLLRFPSRSLRRPRPARSYAAVKAHFWSVGRRLLSRDAQGVRESALRAE